MHRCLNCNKKLVKDVNISETDLMKKNGYEYSTSDGRYKLRKDSPKDSEDLKNERLQQMIEKKAIPLIEKYNKKFNSN